jgi:hypothetical protein
MLIIASVWCRTNLFLGFYAAKVWLHSSTVWKLGAHVMDFDVLFEEVKTVGMQLICHVRLVSGLRMYGTFPPHHLVSTRQYARHSYLYISAMRTVSITVTRSTLGEYFGDFLTDGSVPSQKVSRKLSSQGNKSTGNKQYVREFKQLFVR